MKKLRALPEKKGMFDLEEPSSLNYPLQMLPSISTEKALHFSRDAQRGSTCLTLAQPGTSCLTCRVWSGRRICLASMWGCISRIHGSSRSVHVGFFLELTNVFLVSDSFIPKPVGNLSRQTKEHSSLWETGNHTNPK